MTHKTVMHEGNFARPTFDLAGRDGACMVIFPRRRGGIGRRAGLKIRYPLKMCRFEPDRRYHF